jgi:hypothetical protein
MTTRHNKYTGGFASIFGAAVASLVLAPAVCGADGRPVPDEPRSRDEAIRILSEIIKVDRSNPPGNETRVARYIKSVLDKEGIPSEILELQPGRGNLVARLRGSGKKRPILLLGGRHRPVRSVRLPRRC